MSFDSQTRNKLQRMVGACRRLLTDEFDDQLQGLYGIYALDGRVLELEKLTTLDDDHYQIATLLRERVLHLSSGMASEKQPLAEAVRRVLREQSFTLLNRFAALRMAEERDIVQECVGQGLKSKGFQVFETVARSGLGGAYERYVTFIHGMFDEMSLDLGVLFDRWSPFGLLFPREPALLKFFDLLNDPELKPLWKEDETIGWIYQYFNDEAERRRMREESVAPRNSRELAVRNQFFTPRYVVEFLTDNTLGRIWYEMMQANTRLKEQCRYLVRRPTEIFLQPGEKTPEQPKQDNLSQEELLKLPVHIPHRPLKDPRTILMLDPACGSMHFGLYAFDLFEVIYEEAWELVEGMRDELRGMKPEEITARYPLFSSFITHTSSFESKEEFLRQVPRLIIEHNIHGIDIDPRCAQIAGLSLWLRAQKAWQRLGFKASDRPAIKRSNIVCAEPMPGEKHLLREFVEREFPEEERGIFLRLLEVIFEKMQLAGEAGSLLKIEEEIRTAVEDARRQWVMAQQTPEFFNLVELAGLDQRVAGWQQELLAAERAAMAADLRLLTSDRFWERVEERIYTALRDYSEQAEHAGGFQRRLFAEDAARGFAFIDVCRKRYEVVVMNPPFGASTDAIKITLGQSYFAGRTDLYACSIQRAIEISSPTAAIGAITARTGFFLQSFVDWRSGLLESAGVRCFADLGPDVLDSAKVETAAFVLQKAMLGIAPFLRIAGADKALEVLDAINGIAKGFIEPDVFLRNPHDFSKAADKAWSYWSPPELVAVACKHKAFDPNFGDIRLGVQTNDDFRFSRLWWEVPPDHIGIDTNAVLNGKGWVTFLKGGESSKYVADISMVLNWFCEGDELKEAVTVALDGGHWSRHIQSVECYFLPGISWAVRTENFEPHLVPSGCISSVSRYFAIPRTCSIPVIIGVWNCQLFDFLAKLRMEAWMGPKFVIGVIKELPFPEFSAASLRGLEERVLRIWAIKCEVARLDESNRYFVGPIAELGKTLNVGFLERLDQTELDIETVLNLETDIEQIVSTEFGFASSQLREVFSVQPTTKIRALYQQETLGEDIISLMFGYVMGRWDIRYATSEQDSPELPDPFAPLPVCPPGQLQSDKGLPSGPEDLPADYPIRIPWDGILVDDPNHPLDIERRVREVIAVIWSGKTGESAAEAIEHEACEILGVKSLRDYFRKPAGFFADHLKRYSKSRRQAPIYWPLSTASGSYTLWIYYHRLTDQTLFQCVNDFVKPKLEEVMRDELRIMNELQNGTAASVHTSSLNPHHSKSRREELEELTDFKQELQEFRDELLWVAGLPYKPNLNDGVIITASPLWKLFRLPKWQKDLKACWASLEAGEYDWAHLAYTIWPDRVKKVCKTDRSIAIAHGLEDLCEVKAPEKKAKRGRKREQQMELDGGNE